VDRLGKGIVLMLGVVLVGSCVAGLALGLPDQLFRSGKEKEMADPVPTGPAVRAVIPTIDGAAPTEIETATFALG
jgi:hypothetical protein